VGSICTKVPKPELPAIDISLKADITVAITIQGGKFSKMAVVKETYNPSNVDRKIKRALVSAIQSAVEQYECIGDHVDVPQSFGFTIN
jgi:hypothetical protein